MNTAALNASVTTGNLTMMFKELNIRDVMDMIGQKERVNIVVPSDVESLVSVSLYDVNVDTAIRAIAESAGLMVDMKDKTYYLVKREEVGQYRADQVKEVRSYKIQYSDPEVVSDILESYLSEFGEVTALPSRNLVVVEDSPDFLSKIERILLELDKKPVQILIEAKILEIRLTDNETFGIDWRNIFEQRDGLGNIGIRGFDNPASPGLFFDFVNENIEVALNILKTRGRVKTLATPKLLVMENNEAEVVVGDRLGYRTTTTINQVTTESIQFLESGVILRVTPSVDGHNRILLEVHPEVSSGTIGAESGLPEQTTTEVTTQLLVDNNQTTFIGGLIRNTVQQNRDGIPYLSEIPIVNHLFTNKEEIISNSETIVLITPRVIDNYGDAWNYDQIEKVESVDESQRESAKEFDKKMDYIKRLDFHDRR